MEIAFDAIGFELANENAFHALAEDVGRRGEVTVLQRAGGGVLHGRCLKIGAGLEVWTLLYETVKGEVTYADCRPAFRARYAQKISPWVLSDTTEGKSVIHGFIEDTNIEVLFQLQNLTEVGTRVLEQTTLSVGLCGLAYRAGIFPESDEFSWKSYDEAALNVVEEENYWNLAGRIIAFDTIRNPQSGSDLYWIFVEMGASQIEILVNHRALRGRKPRVGALIEAEVWLQGHVLTESLKKYGYEGVDWSQRPADFWRALRKLN